jgi:hypothetical protein
VSRANVLSVDQLKAFLREKGDKTSGKKGDLVERLLQWYAQHDHVSTPV